MDDRPFDDRPLTETPVSLPPTPVPNVTAPLPIPVRVGSPRVRAHVVPIKREVPGAGAPPLHPQVAPGTGTSEAVTPEGFVTSFIIVWQPAPKPPSLWVRALREAPFGTQLVRASDLRWDGKFLSVELVNEADIDAFAAQMSEWVEYANMQMFQGDRTPSALVLKAARRRALEIENRLRR